MSNYVFEICNLYTDLIIYYLDNENKSLPDCVQAIIVECETPGTSMALPALIRLTLALKPRYVSGIYDPHQGGGYTKDWCIKRVKVVVSTQTK